MENNENITVDLTQDEDNLDVIAESAGEAHHSHSSHHHHSHHSSHHHHSRKSRSSKAKRFFKRNKFKIANFFITVLFVAILVVLGVVLDKRGFTTADSPSANGSSDSISADTASLQVAIPFFEDDVVIVSPAVTKYMSSDTTVSANKIYKEYYGLGRLDVGQPVNLWYEVKSIPDGYNVISAELLVSDNKDFFAPIVYSLDGEETSVDVYNLKTNTQYYYRFVLTLSNSTKTSVEGSFKTANTPRMMSVDGVKNMRDIGGWTTLNGKIIKQGLLYRSAELDGAIDSNYTVTTDGINTLLTVLGIRTDMDLRYEGDNPNGSDALGAGVRHVYYNAQMYSDVFTDYGKTAMRKVFSDLADKSNYPVLLHCTHGMDRTGTVCYLLEAVLGVSEDDMMRDYQLSALYHGDLWSLNQMNEFIGRLKAYDGATVQEKAENYLLSIGVTPEEISSIKSIFLEG